jgi:hypothetical protein
MSASTPTNATVREAVKTAASAKIAMLEAAMIKVRMPCIIQTFRSSAMWALFALLARGFDAKCACGCHKTLTQVRHDQI